jgi:peptidoglycan/LPS O-acetylase OafA/YrhL
MTLAMEQRDSSPEESLSLFNEKTLSDLESDYADDEAERRFPSSSWTDTVKPYIRTARICSWRTLLYRGGFALLPSFIQSRFSTEESKPEKIFPTAYLDGMRGLAALFVFFCHYFYTCFVITFGYGYGEPGTNNNVLQLPIIRLLYSGPPMVCLFFVISGYALSLKPLKLMRARSWDNLTNTMTSSVFRRGLRLFLPTTISTFMVFLLLRLNFYEGTREFSFDKRFMRNIQEMHPEQLESFTIQFYDWVWRLFEFVHVWSWEPFGGSTPYDVHLWTIPVEFRCSMVLFIVLMGVAKLRTWIRFVTLLGVSWFTYRNDRWEMLLFLSGTLLAELDLISAARKATCILPSTGLLASPSSKREKFLRAFWIILGIASLYLMSQPDDGFETTPGWVYLGTLIPEWYTDKYRFYQVLGSILFVLSTNKSKLLQRPFNTSFVQYFGKISYAIYLVHGPVLHVVGYRIERWAWGITGYETRRQYLAGFGLAGVFVVPAVVWAADLFWRGVDVRVVGFARWVEGKCNVKEE